MLQDSLSKIKYLIVLAFLLVIPMQAKAGEFAFDPIDQTDTGADRLVYYYDLVGRDTLIQLTNTSDELACVHVQIFNATAACQELDFEDCLTPGDTNVYDMSNLPAGIDGNLVNTLGFVVVSLESGPEFSLIGMFRVIDEGGYEYRTNAASSEDILAFDADFDILNYNDVNGNNLSDVVGITYVDLDFDQVTASPFIGTIFGTLGNPQILNFDEFETPTSCSPAVFTCDDATINRGIDNSIPNSQGYSPLCNSSKLDADNHAGWVFMPFIDYVCIDPDGTPEQCSSEVFGIDDSQIKFVGFLGLNNGDGTGSMDSWMSFSFGDLQIAEPTAE
jgi:hypothetical protein